MTQTPSSQFDNSSKAVFDDAYTQPDPRMYYEDLGRLGYRIAGSAQPYIAKTISALEDIRGTDTPKVVDIGASYGINAALLNHDVTLDELDKHYRADAISDWDREEVLERDQKYFANHETDSTTPIVGVDVSAPALEYAEDAGLLDASLAVNLEEETLGTRDAEVLSDADLIMSTGAVGYVSEATFVQVLDACGDSKPWVANSVLRMFPYDGFIKLLRDRGYVTEKCDTTLIQRSFATEEEKQSVLARLEKRGLSTENLEANGQYHAEFFLSRPRAEATRSIFTPI